MDLVSGESIVNLPYDPKQEQSIEELTGKPKKEPKNKDIDQNAYACVAGYEFAGTRQSTGFQLGKSGYRVINDTRNNITEVSSLGSDATISGKVTGSGGWKWGVIEAEVGFEIGGSYTWTTSQSTSITVVPGDWGWIDYGTISETWTGNYYYLTSSCGKTGVISLSVKGPKYKSKLARTEVYPY